jgi:polygalacturonase
VFRNIAGAGQLLRCKDVHIEGCSYENMMNAGILMGAELDTHSEGGHAINIVIKDCRFDNCGFKPRYGRFGGACIAIKSQGFNDPHNRNVLIEGNLFRNSSIAVEVRDASDVLIRSNIYEGIRERYVIDSETTTDIRISDR